MHVANDSGLSIEINIFCSLVKDIAQKHNCDLGGTEVAGHAEVNIFQ